MFFSRARTSRNQMKRRDNRERDFSTRREGPCETDSAVQFDRLPWALMAPGALKSWRFSAFQRIAA